MWIGLFHKSTASQSAAGFSGYSSSGMVNNSRVFSFPKEKIKIFFAENIHKRAVEEFRQAGYSDIHVQKQALSAGELTDVLQGCHVLGIRSKTQLTASHLATASRLMAVGAFCIGTNQIDLPAARLQGVPVFNSPYSSTRSVAELVIGLIISLYRRTHDKSLAAHRGEWAKNADGCHEIRGKRLGIIGYGRIGSQVGLLAEALGMRVFFKDIEPKMAMGNAVQVQGLHELLETSDVVTLHVPEDPGTLKLMGAPEFERMRPQALFLNIARGKVIDAQALAASIRAGHLGGAAVDVFEPEPAANTDRLHSPLQGLPNVILTPHIGGSTEEAQEAIGLDVARKLIQFLDMGVTVGSVTLPELMLPVQRGVHRLLHIHENRPGVLADINSRLNTLGINITGQYLKTDETIGYVVLDIEQGRTDEARAELEHVQHTIRVRSLF
jgi:D-3-phosphoglycerate dehydrogenase